MSISGEWWNELKSKLVIQIDAGDARSISGEYHTNVGQAQQKNYPLVGRCDNAGNADQLVSWVVVWDPPDPPTNPVDPPKKPSITAWVGQYHLVNGIEMITTTWLLTRQTTAGDDWNSTLVSMDFFFRTEPSAEMVKLAREAGKAASYLAPAISK